MLNGFVNTIRIYLLCLREMDFYFQSYFYVLLPYVRESAGSLVRYLMMQAPIIVFAHLVNKLYNVIEFVYTFFFFQSASTKPI